MKKLIVILFALVLSYGIVFHLPLVMNKNDIDADITNEVSLVKQEILSYSETEHTYNKIYADGKLIGVISDLDYLNNAIKEKYEDYKEMFPNTELGLADNINIVKETSYVNFNNVDDDIMSYLVGHNLLGIKTTAVEFSTSHGVYEIIYVKNIDDFYIARDAFLLNFVSEETMSRLKNGEQIDEPTSLGTVEMSINLVENISYSDAIVTPSKILTNVNSIYQFLCYGRNTEREYYTVIEGDTLEGVGYHCGDMTPKQIVMLNPDVLSSEDQIITPGMKLNVTYYTSPITINVTKERLTQVHITPEVPEYIEDETIEAGKVKIIIPEESGIKNVLYKEVWTNGVLQSGDQISETIIKQAVRGTIALGTKLVHYIGTGNYIWPVDNPYITCHYGCYLGHTGTDFVNRYNKYGPVYAIDSGVVADVGYHSDMGNYCIINHQNGIRTFYMHMYDSAYVNIGDNVSRGQIIGQIGNTGRSDGAHLHLTFEVNGKRVDSCYYLPCTLLE